MATTNRNFLSATGAVRRRLLGAAGRALRLAAAALIVAAPWHAHARAQAKAADGPADFGELERVVREELKATNTPGAAVAVVSGGRVVFAKGFGVASAETGAPVTADMLFRLGSTTKMFTGAAAVLLAGQGKLKLDAPVGDYAKGLAPRLSRLTAHQLLSNTAGVADFAPPFVSHDDSALSRMVRAWKDDVLFAEPGKVYSYASPGFWLAGYVLEEAGGKPYADVMEETVFKPAGMSRTTFRPHVAMTYPLAVGHNVQEGKAAVVRPAFNNVAMWPAGSIFSNVGDLARFVTALMHGGRLEGKQVFPATLYAALSGRHVSMPGEPGVHYGYGLLHFEERGVRLVMHGGFSRGYGSMIQMAPAHDFAVIVLTNRSGETLNRTTAKAKEMFLPLRPETPAPKKPAAPLSRQEMARFAGEYANGEQVWKIFEKEGKLFMKYGDAEHALSKTADDRLSYGDALENDVAFVAGADGRAEYVFTGLYSARRRAAGATAPAVR